MANQPSRTISNYIPMNDVPRRNQIQHKSAATVAKRKMYYSKLVKGCSVTVKKFKCGGSEKFPLSLVLQESGSASIAVYFFCWMPQVFIQAAPQSVCHWLRDRDMLLLLKKIYGWSLGTTLQDVMAEEEVVAEFFDSVEEG
eukprot:scaffold90928_cov36-Cyclotella_meneghiniana.AAC.5